MENSKSIKYWAESDRPREKLMQKGTEALSDSELVAILLGSGNIKQSAVELARDILKESKNNLNTLGKKTYKDLMQFRGVGEAKAVSIVAALELGRRRKMQEVVIQQKITSSTDAYDYFQPQIGDIPHEEIHILYLTRANTIIDSIKLSQGGTVGTVMDIKIIMKNALERLAQAIIIAHNHPSGNRNPSKQDIQITEKLVNAANFFDISVLDHIIIADKTYYSFKDEDIMPKPE
ncbi:MAG: DNA repair protein RadC [Bacteroidales bacterium]|nr:DNA repair protein RadC [Bacteroidales bacterium]MDD4217326.1 DNA repair protein RadC [Bacteroidales bacterium]MDY0142041.1 DNA repair protein RadC [Bacteroidales bacterium]